MLFGAHASVTLGGQVIAAACNGSSGGLLVLSGPGTRFPNIGQVAGHGPTAAAAYAFTGASGPVYYRLRPQRTVSFAKVAAPVALSL